MVGLASLNAGPEYYAAEEKYRNARTAEEKLAALQEMLKLAPKHKSSESLLLEIKSKMSKVRRETEKEERKKKASKGGKGDFVRKQGAAQVALMGFVNSGKTTLFNLLTGLNKPATPAPFETLTLVPGMWKYEKVNIQVLDMPSMIEANKSKLFAFGRPSDLVVQLVNKDMEKKFFADNNSIFLKDKKILKLSFKDFENVCGLKEKIYLQLDLIRVYTKPPHNEADMSKPIALKKGCTVESIAKEISKDIERNISFAKVWGSSKFPGQQVKSDYILCDGDVVEIHTH